MTNKKRLEQELNIAKLEYDYACLDLTEINHDSCASEEQRARFIARWLKYSKRYFTLLDKYNRLYK